MSENNQKNLKQVGVSDEAQKAFAMSPSPSQSLSAAFLSAVIMAAETSAATETHSHAYFPQAHVTPPAESQSGLPRLTGKYSPTEVARLDAAIENYRAHHNLSSEDIRRIILHKGQNKNSQPFWAEISAAVGRRAIKNTRAHLQRRYNPSNHQDIFICLANHDRHYRAVKDLGQKWTEVTNRVGRMPGDCRDRYRNHLASKDIQKTGRWSKAEEDKLREIVSEMRDAGVGNAFWIEVSKKMGRTRSRQQCSEKWASLLRDPKLAAGSETLIWKCLNLKDFESYQD